MTLLLNARDIEQLLTMRDAVSAMEQGFRDLATGNGIDRPRSHTYVPRPSSPDEDRFYLFKSMDGALPRHGIHGLRISSDLIVEREVGGKRRREKMPAAPGGKYVGLLILFSLETLEPLAIMPDGYLQRTRVGATSAVAAKYLARNTVRRAAIIGTGWQAGAQASGLFEVFSTIEQLKVYSLNPAHRAAFAEEWSMRLNKPVTVTDTAADAVADADVVALATNSQVPVIAADAIPEGCHVGSVQGRELPDALLARAGLIAVRERIEPTFWVMGDRLPREVPQRHPLRESDPHSTKVVTLGDVITGRHPGRTSEREITLFTAGGAGGSAGLATQFVAIGAMIYRRARERGMGRDLPTEWFLQAERP
jgi:ornithine cyclodeaminase/alanine dehydrogenase-like protein (mu-crystallin family)